MCRGELSGVITGVMSSVYEAGGSGRVDLKRNSLNLPLLSCKSGVFVEENLGRKKKIETSPWICSADQWTGFYMIGTSIMKDLTPAVHKKVKYT